MVELLVGVLPLSTDPLQYRQIDSRGSEAEEWEGNAIEAAHEFNTCISAWGRSTPTELDTNDRASKCIIQALIGAVRASAPSGRAPSAKVTGGSPSTARTPAPV